MATVKIPKQVLDDLQSSDVRTRIRAVERLGKAKTPMTDLLVSLLDDENYKVRKAAVQAIRKHARPTTVPVLISLLRDPTATVQKEVARTLGAIGNELAALPLCDALFSRKLSVVQAAHVALLAIGPASAVAVCQTLADRQHTPNLYLTTLLPKLFEMNAEHTVFLILTDARLTPVERVLGLEAVRGLRSAWFRPAFVSDVPKFCEQILVESRNEAERAGAKAVLDYLSLGRASLRDSRSEQSTLLRAAQGGAIAGSSDNLLRASEAGNSSLPEPQPLLPWWKRWFGKG